MPDVVWKCKDQSSFINHDFSKNPQNFLLQKGQPLENLRNFIDDSKINFSDLNYYLKELPSMTAGVFGYMGYDMVRLMEDLPNNNLSDNLLIPDSIFIRPQILLVFDNFYDCLLICAPSYKKHEDYEQLLRKITEVEKFINEPLIQEQSALKNDFKGFNFTANYSKDQYCKMVEKSIEYITAGDIFQVLPSQRFVSDFPEIDEFEFYRCLRSVNPSPFLFYLQFNDFILTGSSPEIMTSKQGKKITVRPLAGTKKRGKNIPIKYRRSMRYI
jgi:anthranilate synthase component 1